MKATPDEMKVEIQRLFGEKIPSAQIVHLEIDPIIDSAGESSLRIKVVVRRRPPREESKRLIEVVDLFRTWLVNHDDERFPYFRLLSEDEERHLQQVED